MTLTAQSPVAVTLAQGAGVSKGLVYGYFPTQWDLANAILAIEIEALASAEFGAAFGTEGLVVFERSVDPKGMDQDLIFIYEPDAVATPLPSHAC